MTQPSLQFKAIAVAVTVAAITITMWICLDPPRPLSALLAPVPGILLGVAILLDQRQRQGP